jgi:hypothetical protein
MADIRKLNCGEGLPSTGLRPLYSEYADRYLNFHRTAADSGKKPRTVGREGHSLVHWKKKLGNVRLDKIAKPQSTQAMNGREQSLKNKELISPNRLSAAGIVRNDLLVIFCA